MSADVLTTSNFDFMKTDIDLKDLHNTAVTAEISYVNHDYEAELFKLRKIAEEVTKQILDLNYQTVDEYATFNDNLRKIAQLNLVDKKILDILYFIKNNGNEAVHHINNDYDKNFALEMLSYAYTLLVWFVNTYENDGQSLIVNDFKEPQTRLYVTNERKLIYVQTADNSNNEWPQFEGLEKVGDATADDLAMNNTPNSDDLRNAATKRIKQYMTTSHIPFNLQWAELAYRKTDHTWFRDYDVHRVLLNSGVKKSENEWFQTDVATVRRAIDAVKEGRTSITQSQVAPQEITLRPEQKAAVAKTRQAFRKYPKMLWNAKMRFGKTITALELIKEEKYQKVLIMTHRPVVKEGWHDDFNKMNMAAAGYNYFTKDTLTFLTNYLHSNKPFIYFASIQDLRGSKVFGGNVADKNELIADIDWDLVIIDEAHEGTQTDLAQSVLNKVIKSNTKLLELSGTPFNLLNQYDEDQVYTWDYVMEQEAKLNWYNHHPDEHNPYEELPKVSMYTFEISQQFKNDNFINIENHSFNFKEFFRVDDNGEFVHKDDVRRFLDNITTPDERTNYPFSTKAFRENLRHTLWILPGVKEARALAALMKKHPVFGAEYNIINIVDNGDADYANESDVKRVNDAITADPANTKTITLTVRKLTTGVTIKPWNAVIFLSNINSAMTYLQAAFRAQTPYSDPKLGMKTNAYIFDFAPDRALKIMSASTKLNTGAGKRINGEQRKETAKLLNFLPIIGIEGNEMKPYKVDTLLTKLKQVYAEKAVETGFDDDSIYSDELLMIDDDALNEFNNLKAIVGTTKKEKAPSKIDVNNNHLSDEEYDQAISAEQKAKKVRTKEEQAALDKLNSLKKQKRTLVSILRSVSIRIPLMIYGMDMDINEDIDIYSFVNKIDDESWQEFMPNGVTKDLFRNFIKYYDPEIFIEAGKIIRNRVKSFDSMDPLERTENIALIFKHFKNPDKETVLTPWRVVNMQLGKTIGGLSFFDDNYQETMVDGKSATHWINTDLTNEAFKPDTHILEINAKTGLYPLYAAASLYYQRFVTLNNQTAGKFSLKDEQNIWRDVLKHNIFVIAKTPMAKTITERTLCGFENYGVNIKYIQNIVENAKKDVDEEAKKIKEEFNNMKFDVVIGNPPYQGKALGDNKSYTPPIYNYFMDLSYKLADISILITPARFLFNAGGTPKPWNKKMLHDEHLKVIMYEPNSDNIFPHTDIKGGLVITCHNNNENYGSIDTFTQFSELRSILRKVTCVEGMNYHNLSELYYAPESYKLNKILWVEHPELKSRISKGHLKDVSTNIFEKLPEIFIDNPKDKNKYYKFIGRYDNKRVYKYVLNKYIDSHDNLDKYKVILPKSNGSGALGEVLSTPLIGTPLIGHTQTFISIGAFDSKYIAENVMKYIKTKFARTMLGIKKVTQDNKRNTWQKVPLQDFTSNSDIDWSKSVHEIDQQLYEKYNLTQEEIDFIESHVQEME